TPSPSCGASPTLLSGGGRSPGGHLAAGALVPEGAGVWGVPADIVKGGICSSGMYDLKAVRVSKRSAFIRFTDEIKWAMSPQRHLDQLRAPVVVTCGTNETPEFQRQARDSAGRRQESRTDRSAELQPLRNGRVIWKPVRPKRPCRAHADAAAASWIERVQFMGRSASLGPIVFAGLIVVRPGSSPSGTCASDELRGQPG